MCRKSSETILKAIELDFARDFKKSGRSGNNGKKFNIQAREILNKRKDKHYLDSTGCYDNEHEKQIFVDFFSKIARQKTLQARSINHKTQR